MHSPVRSAGYKISRERTPYGVQCVEADRSTPSGVVFLDDESIPALRTGLCMV
ncbi:MAG: hypothetical protein WD038_06935 [Balneolales bacterium]